jgi:hypothetical protein
LFEGENFALPTQAFLDDGRTLLGWKRLDDGSGVVYNPGTVLSADDSGNMIFSAYYQVG